MKKLVILCAFTALLLAGCTQTTPAQTQQPETSQIAKYNCEQSSGTFNNGTCNCPEVENDQFTYDADTGYCMTSFGIPGGALGETEKKLQELVMLKNQ